MITVGGRIRRERRLRGWNQAQLAAQVPVGQQTVSRWERDLTRPADAEIGRLVEIFGLDPDLIATWINSPSSAAAPETPSPPTRPLLRDLPLADLSPPDFERFCRMFIRLLAPPPAQVHRYGDQGDEQGGIDLYAEEPDGTITTYQCKRYQQRTGFGPEMVKAAIAANTHQDAGHVIVLSCIASAAARNIVKGFPKWDIWDSEDVADTIREQLDEGARIQLVDRFFPGHRRDFLGIHERGPWLAPESFFLPFADPSTLVNHARPLTGHDELLAKLIAFCTDTSPGKFAVLKGAGGSGKSRVLKAVVDAFPPETSLVRLQFLSSHARAEPGHVDDLPRGRAVLIIDDAHDTPGLEALFAAIATQRPSLRVITAIRPHALGWIRSVALRAGLTDSPVEFSVLQLSRPETAGLAAHVLARTHPEPAATHIAQQVAALTYDCPLATVLTAELLNRKRISPQAVSADPAFRDHVDAAFRAILTGGLGDAHDRQVIDRLLEFFALLQPLVPDHPSFGELLQAVIGKSHDELRRHLGILETAGVLLRRDGRMWLTPGALADVIAERACIDPGTSRPTGYADRLFEQELQGIGLPLRNLLVNLGKVDWRLSAAPGVPQAGLLDGIWSKIRRQFAQTAHPAQGAAILNAITEVAYYQPRQALSLARYALGDMSASGTSEACDASGTDLLVPELARILRNAAYTFEYTADACELLWALAKISAPARTRTGSAALEALREIAAYAPGKTTPYHQEILKTALSWLDAPQSAVGPSPFDVLDVLLTAEATQTEYGDMKFTFRTFPVDPDAVRPLRETVISAAATTVTTGPLQQAIRALKTLERALRPPRDVASASNHVRQSWNDDLLRVLKQLELIASTQLEPLLYTEIREGVRWHVEHGDLVSQAAACAVLTAIPNTLEVRLTRYLVEGDTWAYASAGSDGYVEGPDSHGQTAREFSSANLDAHSTVTILCERLRTITSVYTGRRCDPGPFLTALIHIRPDIGHAAIDHVMADASCQLRNTLSVIMSSVADADQAGTVISARRFLALGDQQLDLQIARAYSFGLRTSTDLHADEITLIAELSQHPAPGVRATIAHAARRLTQVNRRLAVRFLLGIDFEGDAEVAASVLSQICSGAIGIDSIEPAEQIQLLNQLAFCPDIDGPSIERFLTLTAQRHPVEMTAMLMARIGHSEERGWGLEQALPLSWESLASSPVNLHDHPWLSQVLGTVMDWLACAAPGRIAVLGPCLFPALAGSYDDTVIAILQAWLNAHFDQRGIETVASCLSNAPAPALLDHHLFITSLLEAASSFGADCMASVRTQLVRAGITRPYFSAGRTQPLTEREFLNGARQITTQLPARSPARAFYRELADHAEEIIRMLACSKR